jgi:ankyrin repeat protein
LTLILTACDSPESAWEKAREKDTIAAYEKFGAKYPGSPNHDAALQRIDWLNKTVIHRAAQDGDLELVTSMLGSGTDVNYSKGWGGSPLHAAAAGCQLPVAELLLAKGAEVSARDASDATPLHYAARAGCLDAVKLLLERGGDLEVQVRVGLQGFSIQEGEAIAFGGQQPGTKGTPLHWAAAVGKGDVVELLISKGAIVDTINDWGESPLHLAAVSDDLPTVKVLLEHGAIAQYGSAPDERYPTKSGQPLHYAQSIPVVETLVAHGATIDVTSPNTGMPIHIAASRGNKVLVEYYLGKGIDADAQATWNLGSGWSYPVTPAWTAAKYGYLDIVELLQAHDADLAFKTEENGGRAGLLHAAAVGGNPELVTFLLDHGLPIDARADVSTERTMFAPLVDVTPLAVAAFFGRRDAIEVLLARGADIAVTVNRDWDIFIMSLQSGDPELVRYLLEQGAPIKVGAEEFQNWRVSDEMKVAVTEYLRNRTAGPSMAQ